MKKGALCISLDFEKFWGIHDVADLEKSKGSLAKVSTVVTRLLKLFDKYEIHCTWGIVGMLNFDNYSELNTYCKGLKPAYLDSKFSPFPIIKYALDKVDSTVFLAAKEIEEIRTYTNQEIASHTFSHYYCLEKGKGPEEFQLDIDRFKEKIGSVKTIIFPRNQVDEKCLKICLDSGMHTYRGNQENKFWKNSTLKEESISQKIGRTLDAYLKISKDNLIDWSDLKTKGSRMLNIPASRFLRPHQFSTSIEKLKISRIKKQMLKAAQQNKIYHLWWHPHNFTTNIDANFNQLEELLKYYNKLKLEYGFISLNMNEISERVG